MKPRVLFVDTGREWGGGTNSLLLLAGALVRRGYPVDAAFNHDYRGEAGTVGAAFARAGVGFHLLPPAPAGARKLARESLRLLLAFHRDGRARALDWLEARGRIAPMARRLAALAGRLGARLLVGNNQPSSNREVLLAGRLAGLPVVLHVRKTTDLNAAERELAASAARRIVCVSESVRAHYLAQGLPAGLCLTVPNGIDPEGVRFLARDEARAALGLPAGAFVVGTVCSLLPLKCVDHLLRAVAGLPGVHLAVIGDGPERGRLEALAGELALGDRCRFAGFRADAASLLPALDAFALASRQEGMPRSLLEAMLAGLPVLAADVPGCRDLVREGTTGFLYPHGDLAAMAGRLQALAADPALRRRLGEAGRADVLAHYSLAAHVDRVAAVIDGAAA